MALANAVVVTRIYQRIHMPFNVSRTEFAGIQIFRMLDPDISLNPKMHKSRMPYVCVCVSAYALCRRVRVRR